MSTTSRSESMDGGERDSLRKPWNIFEHFCSVLEGNFEQFKDSKFNSIHIMENNVAKSLFALFKKEITRSKDWKGFPTSKGHRKSEKGIPQTTKMPKDHVEISAMFSGFIKKFEEKINCDVNEAINGPAVVNNEVEVGVSKKRPPTVEESIEEFIKKRKTINNEPSISSEMILDMKRELRNAIDSDVNSKNKFMSRTKQLLDKANDFIETSAPKIENELKLIEEERQRVMKELEEKEQYIKLKLIGEIKELSDITKILPDFISKKEEEYAEYQRSESEELSNFFSTLK